MTTYNLKEVSEILNISTRTARRYIEAGILPMRKMNGKNSPYKISERRFQKWFDKEWSDEHILNTIL